MQEVFLYGLFATIFTTGGLVFSWWERVPRSRVLSALRWNLLSHATGFAVAGTAVPLLGLPVVGPPALGPVEFGARLCGAAVVADLWFFAVHSVLHRSRFLFRRVHSVHHFYTKPIALEALAVHPAEHALLNIGAFAAGAAVAAPGPLGCAVLACLAALSALWTHSPLAGWSAYSRHHQDHHLLLRGNFAVSRATDSLFGTNLPETKPGRQKSQRAGS